MAAFSTSAVSSDGAVAGAPEQAAIRSRAAGTASRLKYRNFRDFLLTQPIELPILHTLTIKDLGMQ